MLKLLRRSGTQKRDLLGCEHRRAAEIRGHHEVRGNKGLGENQVARTPLQPIGSVDQRSCRDVDLVVCQDELGGGILPPRRGEQRLEIRRTLPADIDLVPRNREELNGKLLPEPPPPLFGSESVEQRGAVDRMGHQGANWIEGDRAGNLRFRPPDLQTDLIPGALRDLGRLPFGFLRSRAVEVRADGHSEQTDSQQQHDCGGRPTQLSPSVKHLKGDTMPPKGTQVSTGGYDSVKSGIRRGGRTPAQMAWRRAPPLSTRAVSSRPPQIGLKGADREIPARQRLQAVYRHPGRLNGRVIRDAVHQRLSPDGKAVRDLALAENGVDHQGDLPVDDLVDDVRAPLGDLLLWLALD